MGTDPSGATTLTPVATTPQLSQDGRTLLLTPSAPLGYGVNYQLQIRGFAGLAGGTAPIATFTYTTLASGTPSSATSLDFTQILLTYPDTYFNVSVTIPAGCVPPESLVQITAPGMGSVGTGTMPASGDLTFTLKANTGERLSLSVQLPSGLLVTGYVSRYTASDGSGRTTIGADGGRVDSADGNASAIFAPGALEAPVELIVRYTPQSPEELDPTVAAREIIVGRVQVLTTGTAPIPINQRPILQVVAPANPSTVQQPAGMGAYAVFDRVQGFNLNGTPCVFFQIADTAAVSGSMLKSMGGLPTAFPQVSDLAAGSLSSQFGNHGSSTQITSSAVGSIGLTRTLGPGRSFNGGSLVIPTAAPATEARRLMEGVLRSETASIVESTAGIADIDLSGNLMGLLDCSFICAGPEYIVGFVNIALPTAPLVPDQGAYVFVAPMGDCTVQLAGQMVAQTDAVGNYILADCSIGPIVEGGGQVLALDSNYGVSGATANSAPFNFINGQLYNMPDVDLVVLPVLVGDHQAPYAQVSFAKMASTGLQSVTSGMTTDALYVCVQAHDNVTPWQKLSFNIQVDGTTLGNCSGGCGSTQDWSTLNPPVTTTKNGLSELCFPLGALEQGKHAVSVTVFDESCNRTALTMSLNVIAPSTSECEPQPVPSSGCVTVDGGLNAASLTTFVQITFTSPVTGIGPASLLLEHQSGGTWTGDSAQLYFSGTNPCALTLVPTLPLMVNTSYRVRWTSAILDSHGGTPSGSPALFTTSGLQPYMGQPIGMGHISDMTAIGNAVYVAGNSLTLNTWGDTISYWVYDDSQWLSQGILGPGGDSGFFGQTVSKCRAFPQVNIGQSSFANLLLVTTAPALGDEEHQCVLWGFQACGQPSLLFAVSLGPGANGYAPSLDCMNGLVVVGRLASSLAIIDIPTAIAGWNSFLSGGGDPRQLITPQGVNQSSIIQSLWLLDPNGTVLPCNWGVGLIPGSGDDSTGQRIDISVGFLSSPIRGMPTIIASNSGPVWNPQPSFMGPANGVDSRVVPCAVDGGAGVTRIATLTNMDLVDQAGNDLGFHNLAIGLEGNSAITVVDETNPSQPIALSHWAAPGPILYRMPVVDDTYPLVAVPVQQGSQVNWNILSLQVEGQPTLVTTVLLPDSYGAMSAGVFYSACPGTIDGVPIAASNEGQVPDDSVEGGLRKVNAAVIVMRKGSKATPPQPPTSPTVPAQCNANDCTWVDKSTIPPTTYTWQGVLDAINKEGYTAEDVLVAFTAYHECGWSKYILQNSDSAMQATVTALIDAIYNAGAHFNGLYQSIVLNKACYEVYLAKTVHGPDRRAAVATGDVNTVIFEILKESGDSTCEKKINRAKLFDQHYLSAAKLRRTTGKGLTLWNPRTWQFISFRAMVALNRSVVNVNRMLLPGTWAKQAWEYYEEYPDNIGYDKEYPLFCFYFYDPGYTGRVRVQGKGLVAGNGRANQGGASDLQYPIVHDMNVGFSPVGGGNSQYAQASLSGVGTAGVWQAHTSLPFGTYKVFYNLNINPANPGEGVRPLSRSGNALLTIKPKRKKK